MLGKLLPLTLAAVMTLAGTQTKKDDSVAPHSPRPFAVHVTKPPLWKNACLQVSIDRVNRSSNPLFLPAMGLYISSSAVSSTAGSGERQRTRWFTVYGASDILDSSATPLAPGATEHGDYCVGPTVAITNLQKKTRRQLPLRGKLRIDASYFLTKQDWRTHESQVGDMFRTPPSKWPSLPKVLQPKVVTVIVPIPCRESACNPDCDQPPLYLSGEMVVVPDTLSDAHGWNERGKAITEELERNLAPCPAP